MTKPNVSAKPKRGVGQAISRRRRSIAEKQKTANENRIAREREHAQNVIRQQRQRHQQRLDPVVAQRINATRHALNVLSSDHRAFMAAAGHPNVHLAVSLKNRNLLKKDNWRPQHQNDSVEAYTDFANIVVNVPTPQLSQSIKDFIIEVRGILHHESGPVRFTVPFGELLKSIEVSLADHPILTEDFHKFHKPWNALEDQRMECAVVRATPRIANYFIPMVLSVVLSSDSETTHMDDVQKNATEKLGPWLALAGRTYFPDSVRLAAKQKFDEFGQHFGITSDEWFDIVSRYMSATSAHDMALAVYDAYLFFHKITDVTSPNGEGQGKGGEVFERSDMSEQQTYDALFEKVTNSEEDHDAMHKEKSKATFEDGATQPEQPKSVEIPESDIDDIAGDEGEGEGESSSGRGNASSELQDALRDILKKVGDSAEVEDILARVNGRVGSGQLPSETNEHARPMHQYYIDEAKELSGAIYEALDAFRSEKSPILARRQEQGYLDALEYRTREHGDTTYHVDPQNWDNNGLGLHVSFLADRSGSMHNDMVALSQTVWAVKTACDDLGVPSTMVMWADTGETSRVYDENTDPVIFHSRGGTYPTLALDDIENHVTDNNLHHLVFIFTDGEWSGGVISVDDWKQENRTFVIIGLNCEKYISDKGADVTIPISSINELGIHVKSIITDYVASL